MPALTQEYNRMLTKTKGQQDRIADLERQLAVQQERVAALEAVMPHAQAVADMFFVHQSFFHLRDVKGAVEHCQQLINTLYAVRRIAPELVEYDYA